MIYIETKGFTPNYFRESKEMTNKFLKIHSLHERKVKVNALSSVFVLLLLILLPLEESCLTIALILKSFI